MINYVIETNVDHSFAIIHVHHSFAMIHHHSSSICNQCHTLLLKKKVHLKCGLYISTNPDLYSQIFQ